MRPIVLLRFATRPYPAGGVSRILRLTSIAELPLLLNVLRGDLGIIGPPPIPAGNLDDAPEMPVRPGLGSWVRLARWGAINLPIAEAELRDRNRSLPKDIHLLFLSLRAVFQGRFDDTPPDGFF
ncbi:MAG: sugar transferase [Actinobacteria bacterium]|nr:sugar transferase [Actinomycetota bacterium]